MPNKNYAKKLCQKIMPKNNSKKLIPKIIFQPHENYGQTPLPSVTSFVPTSTPMPSTIPSTTTTSTMASTIPSTPSPLSSGISFRSLDFFFFGHHRKLPMFELNRNRTEYRTFSSCRSIFPSVSI